MSVVNLPMGVLIKMTRKWRPSVIYFNTLRNTLVTSKPPKAETSIFKSQPFFYREIPVGKLHSCTLHSAPCWKCFSGNWRKRNPGGFVFSYLCFILPCSSVGRYCSILYYDVQYINLLRTIHLVKYKVQCSNGQMRKTSYCLCIFQKGIQTFW